MDVHPNPRSWFKDTGYDPRYITITEGDPDKGGRVTGHLRGNPHVAFTAHVTDMAGSHGIDGGRVAKLVVSSRDLWLLVYDLGWIKRQMTAANTDILRRILRGFPERTLREPLPETRRNFARSARPPAWPDFNKRAEPVERASVYRFRDNARSAGRSR